MFQRRGGKKSIHRRSQDQNTKTAARKKHRSRQQTGTRFLVTIQLARSREKPGAERTEKGGQGRLKNSREIKKGLPRTMSYPKYQRMQDDVPISQSPPPYMENQPYLPQTPTEPTHCVEGEKSPVVPPEDLEWAESKRIPVLHQPQTIIVVPVQPTEEPDYMAYSLFTVLCCFLPLGAAAFVFSKLTQRANREGNITAARKHSKRAVILSHISLGIGLLLLILYLIIIMK